jgi:putative ABC transport system permease protein
MNSFLKDLRYGLRMLAKKPGFTAVAVITLALGIGANSAIFSVVNGLLLSPLPYHDSERLVIIWSHSPGANVAQDWPSPGQYSAIKSQNTTFEEIAIAHGRNVILTGRGMPAPLGVVSTSSNLFSLLDVKPQLGRAFLPEDDAGETATTVILSDGVWQQRFGGDPNVLGQSLTLSGKLYTIVGVMPADFALGNEVMPTVASVQHAELLLPLPLNAEAMAQQGDENYNVLARLKDGATLERAQAELDAVVSGLEVQFPDSYPASRRFSLSVKPLLEQVVGDVRPALLVLLGAVGCVLLIACANVANLLLARAATREKEMAIRTALGAGRWRVMRQLLTESVMLAMIGGALGLVIAMWSLDGLRWLNPGNIPRLQNIGVDGRVLAFTFGAALLTGVLFGLVPALRGSRVSLSETLKEGGRSLVGTSSHRLRNLLVIAEIGLSLLLLIGAGLLIRSFVRVHEVEPGFDAQNVLSMRMSVVGTGYAEQARRLIFYQQLSERIRNLPGVESVGSTSSLPLTGGVGWGSITIEGYDPASGQSMIQADFRIAGVGYFETMKIPLINGRFFTDQDTSDSMKVAIIDENMASTYWPDADPIGKRFKVGGANSDAPWLTVVGVVSNVKQYALDTNSRVSFYWPHQQAPASYMYVTVRTALDSRSQVTAVTDAARSIDGNVTVYDVKTMEQRLSDSLARRRFAMFALGLFAVVAMVLAAVGIYGVMSYSVTQRTREIGIRMALGAPSRDVLKLVVGHGMLLAAIGVCIGLASAFAATRLMTSLLFGVSATDPATFVIPGFVLASVALLACYIPARRAARVDPMVALRNE